jgi:hypothetical protein
LLPPPEVTTQNDQPEEARKDDAGPKLPLRHMGRPQEIKDGGKINGGGVQQRARPNSPANHNNNGKQSQDGDHGQEALKAPQHANAELLPPDGPRRGKIEFRREAPSLLSLALPSFTLVRDLIGTEYLYATAPQGTTHQKPDD